MRRVVRTALVVAGVAGLIAVVPASAASAHPLGNFTVNLYSGIVVTPGLLEVHEVIDMAEIPTFQELGRIDVDADDVVALGELASWANAKGEEVARGLMLEVDGESVPLASVSATAALLPGQAGLETLRVELAYRADVTMRGTVVFTDRNYEDRIGWREITATGEGGFAVRGSSVPAVSVSEELRSYPQDLLSSPLDLRRATFSFIPGRQRDSGLVSVGGASEAGTADTTLGSLVAGDRLSPQFVALALLAALGLGALHALGPGHGKTIMAAYLVGAGARLRQAIAGGAAVSAMHTASVFAVGLLVLSTQRLFPPERVYPWLGILAGGVAFSLGATLLVLRARRARAAAGHEHLHAQSSRPGRLVSRRGLAALAISGGLLPSPTAIVVLLAAVALGRMAFGMALILAFSVGLAVALVAVVVFALQARDLLAARFNGRVASFAPVVSAAAITVVGVVMTLRGASEL